MFGRGNGSAKHAEASGQENQEWKEPGPTTPQSRGCASRTSRREPRCEWGKQGPTGRSEAESDEHADRERGPYERYEGDLDIPPGDGYATPAGAEIQGGGEDRSK